MSITVLKSKRQVPNYSLYAWGLIFFFTLLQVVRWKMLPQFIDDYYHLLVAQNFIKAGGWVGWDFFEYAPWGRPHLYPPVYHMVLSFFLKIGVQPLVLLKTVEVAVVPAFLITLFLTARKMFSGLFAFFAVLICGSYFHFFVSLTSNVPATLALVFGLAGSMGIVRRDTIAAVGGLVLCAYTHTGISLAFLSGSIVFFILQRQSLRWFLTVIFSVVLFSSPLWLHQLKYLHLVRQSIAAESRFVHMNIAVLLCGCAGLWVLLRRKGPYYLIIGLIIGFSIVFFRYFYRYFAAQGFLPWALAASAWCAAMVEYLQRKSVGTRRVYYPVFLGLWALFFFFTPTFALDNMKPSWSWTDSTFNNYSSGGLFKSVPYNTLYSHRYFSPVEAIISAETDRGAIITSNSAIVSVMIAALTNRFTADALFREVKPPHILDQPTAVKYPTRDTFMVSGVVVWVKSAGLFPLPEYHGLRPCLPALREQAGMNCTGRRPTRAAPDRGCNRDPRVLPVGAPVERPEASAQAFYTRMHQLTLLYENELFAVYRAPVATAAVTIPKSRHPFWLLYPLLAGIGLTTLLRGLWLLKTG